MPVSAIVPTSKETDVGIRFAIESAERHLRAADLLAEANEFGLGLSHLILASEEAIKAAVYGWVATRCPYPPKFVEKFLRQHGVRHKMAEHLAVMENGIREFLERAWAIEAANPSGDPRSNRAYFQAAMELPDQLGKRIKDDPPADLYPKPTHWWRDANRQKNRGFYVDYENGTWSTPSDVSAAEFTEARESVAILISVVAEAGREWIQEAPSARRKKIRRYFDMLRLFSGRRRKPNVEW
jgi:AbiV family abortive infection protein